MNQIQFQKDLSVAIETAGIKSIQAAFNSASSENETANSVRDKLSKLHAEELASISTDLADIITKYIKTITVVPVLANSKGAFVGTITLT